MAAIVTDQFRILNANNFVETVENSANSYYVVVGLVNPTTPIVGFGRSEEWNTQTPNPLDNFNYSNHVGDTMTFGKKVTTDNVRRLITRRNWSQGTKYEMYRHDYSLKNPSPITGSSRLYDSSYYVMNQNFDVYVCIDNGSTGILTTGNASQDEPVFTDLEPSRAGESGDGYIWKYLFTVPPNDIIKFDSTEYISVPSNWPTATTTQIQSVRENGDSTINNNQIRKVYIEKQGFGYTQNQSGVECDIIGDGTGAKVVIDTDSEGKITKTNVSSGGSGYTYGMVDLGPVQKNTTVQVRAKLVPIIPPSRGHGYDLYKELGTDKLLVYARFDDSTKDFPTDTKFAQISIIKNPTINGVGSTITFTANQFSSVNAIKVISPTGTPAIGEKITQTVTGGTAKGYIVSFDSDTNVLKYYQDRSLYFNDTTGDQTDYNNITSEAKVLDFESSAEKINAAGGFQASVDQNFSGISTNPEGNKVISLGVNFENGLANPEINKGSGEVVYLDNRATITRNSRQKEDIKIILEF